MNVIMDRLRINQHFFLSDNAGKRQEWNVKVFVVSQEEKIYMHHLQANV